jgi:hypothetical protein
MTMPELATAVREAVGQWMNMTLPAQRLAEMANPTILAASLGAQVQMSLVHGGHTLAAIRNHVDQAPYCHLQQVFDPNDLGDTPLGPCPVPDTGTTMAARAAMLALHGALSLETVSYGTENDGSLFVNIVAMPGTGASAEKSKKELRGHTDGVSFPFNGEDDPKDPRIAPAPDFVTLAGLRNPKDVPTKLMPLTALLTKMSPSDVAELKKAQYSIRSQKSFVQGMKLTLGEELVVVNVPVLKDVANGTHVRYSHSAVIPTASGGAAEQASNNLEANCNQTAIPIVVQPGDVLIINNRCSLHGRGEVGEDVGAESRWLLRTYALDTSSLASNKRSSGGRPQHVLFP